ncbi:MAG: mandelate racemase/muconate lactonizing enzyme family protein [Deltaproteobacteria bacterium]|nr:mandelate racemase/muconate lactonizing enzyme family protein [Deltaproteobacteria bacterium]
MKITRIDLWHVAVPLPAPFRPSWIPGFTQTENRFTLIRLTTASGIQGYSAIQCMGKERAGFGALLGPYLLGERVDDIPSIRQRIREMGYLGMKLGWLEPACWDILGKAAGKPVYEMLGGAPGRVKLYASTGEVRSGAERVEEVKARMEEGFDAVKLRVHDATLEEDIAQITETRKGVGDDVVLGVDANQGWRVAVIGDAPRWDLARAIAFCRAAAEAGFEWVEEPLPADAYDDMVALRKAVDVAIAGGELNGHGLPEFTVMLEKGCLDVYQPDAVFTGGIAATMEIARRVKAAGMKYSPHTWTNGIGFAINLQLFAATAFRSKRLEYPYDPPGWVPEGRDGLLVTPFVHDKGEVELPKLPGLGFEIDRRALRRYGRHFFVATPARVAYRAVLDRGLNAARALGKVRDARIADRSAEVDRLLAAGGTAVGIALDSVTGVDDPTLTG